MAEVQLDPTIEDSINWSWEKDGAFSARSAYAAKFAGLELSPTASFTWKPRAPLQCRFFNWLAIRNRCWTSDRLARRGLPHQAACPFCDQHDETMDHLLVTCVFAREIWLWVLTAAGRQAVVATSSETLQSWCIRQEQVQDHRRTTRAITLLVSWELWKHRNGIVFDGVTPSTMTVIERINTEGRVWREAGLLKGDLEGFFAGLSRRIVRE